MKTLLRMGCGIFLGGALVWAADAIPDKSSIAKDKIKQEEAAREARLKVKAEAKKVEMQAFYARQKISTNLVQKYDLNKNGYLDPYEWQLILQDRRKMREDAEAAKGNGGKKP